jgi:cobyrinic acid a,c-diamide synthase
MNRLLISAAHKSSGKTTLTIGLCAALRSRGLTVQPFKKGPDYIDPMWLTLAAGRDCHNLDFYLMSREEILATFARRTQGGDIALIEGNKGLYDGLNLDGSNSNAALAQLLGAPVVLVIDARGMTRGIAPLILGYQAFDPNIRIAGVILNQLGGSRHESKLRAVIEHYTDVAVLGAVHFDDRLAIVERHLGLMPSNEAGGAADKIRVIADTVARQVDLEQVIALAASAPRLATPGPATLHPALSPSPFPEGEGGDKEPSPGPLPRPHPHSLSREAGEGGESADATSLSRGPRTPVPGVPPMTSPIGEPSRASHAASIRLGIARDEAFGFYYPGDLEALQAAGAELVMFDTLHDSHLPEVDGLFIGGGFPEARISELAANAGLKRDIRAAIESGLPAYAECGGLMYLSRGIRWGDQYGEMVGVVPGDTVMHPKPQGRGYVRLRETDRAPWPLTVPGSPPAEIPGHEFHYSSLENLPDDLPLAFEVLRGHGLNGRYDGIVHKNLLACYSHQRDLEGNHWAARFVAFVRRHRRLARDTQRATG